MTIVRLINPSISPDSIDGNTVTASAIGLTLPLAPPAQKSPASTRLATTPSLPNPTSSPLQLHKIDPLRGSSQRNTYWTKNSGADDRDTTQLIHSCHPRCRRIQPTINLPVPPPVRTTMGCYYQRHWWDTVDVAMPMDHSRPAPHVLPAPRGGRRQWYDIVAIVSFFQFDDWSSLLQTWTQASDT